MVQFEVSAFLPKYEYGNKICGLLTLANVHRIKAQKYKRT